MRSLHAGISLRFFFLCLCLCALAGCDGQLVPGGSGEDPGAPDPATEPPPRLRITGDNEARLRDGPGGNTIAHIPVGCLVDPIGPPDFGWLPVVWRNMEGWVYGGDVERVTSDAADCMAP